MPEIVMMFVNTPEREPRDAAFAGASEDEEMAIRSKKFEEFVHEPMGDKPITAVSGINEELGAKLAANGFDKAYILLGQFLLLKKQCAAFQNWLKLSYGASSRQAEQCALCLLEWCYAFL
ncbi:barrier-to-autointegration factor-like protein isoform X3 [Pogona vitticeps]|nr:barrier-to-autointegration factor-like protein isoform X3 [Pogona vitticeps]